MTTFLMICAEDMWLTKGIKAVPDFASEPTTYLDNYIGISVQPRIKFNHSTSPKSEEWLRGRDMKQWDDGQRDSSCSVSEI